MYFWTARFMKQIQWQLQGDVKAVILQLWEIQALFTVVYVLEQYLSELGLPSSSAI